MKWFISDIHADHAKVLVGPRGDAFPTIEAWRSHIYAEIARCVTKADELFVLGDAIGTMKKKELAKFRNNIKKGKVWLIRGNHDPKEQACIEIFGKNFRHVHMTKICGVPTWLSHYAHAFWPGSHRGYYHIYAHQHGMREETLDAWMPERRSMEVCPEVIYSVTGEWRPINEFEIHALLSKKKGHDPVDFYERQRPSITKKINDAGLRAHHASDGRNRREIEPKVEGDS